MKFFFDLFPVILFFVTFKFADRLPLDSVSLLESVGLSASSASDFPILLATLVVMVATLFQVLWSWGRYRKVDGVLLLSLGLVLVMGGLTLLLHDAQFIKWKPSLLYGALGGGILVSTFAFRLNPLQRLLSSKITLPHPVWQKLNLAWGLFFVALAGVNLYVAEHFSTETWVNFKLFGLTGLLLVFILVQGFFLAPYLQENTNTGDV